MVFAAPRRCEENRPALETEGPETGRSAPPTLLLRPSIPVDSDEKQKETKRSVDVGVKEETKKERKNKIK